MWKCKYGDEYLFADDLFLANHTFSDIFDLKSVWVNNLLSFNFIVYFSKLLWRGFKVVLFKLFSQRLVTTETKSESDFRAVYWKPT